MAGDTITPHLKLIQPEPHASPLDWGIKINSDLSLIDLAVQNLDNGFNAANQIVLNKATVAPGNPIYGQLNSVTRWVAEFGNGSPETGSNQGSDFSILRYNDAGTQIDTPFTINRATGSATFVKQMTCQAGITAIGGININGSAPVLNLCDATGAGKGYLYWQASDNTVALARGGGATLVLSGTLAYFSTPATVNGLLTVNSLTSVGNVTIAGNLTVNGVFSNPSDARLKTVINDYDGGLNDLLQLRPVVYRYNNDDTHRSHVGLVAQEAELAMPELVSMGPGVIDGVEVDDLRSLDSTALVFALINSIRELKTEIDELKAKIGGS